MSRHGKEPRDVWAGLLRNAEALIFAPEFSATKYPGESSTI